MGDRRSFIRRLSAFSATTILTSLTQPAWSRNLEAALRDAENVSPEDLADEEDFWYYVQQAFTRDPRLINLNNAGVSPAPIIVQDTMKQYYDMSNELPSWNMWKVLDAGRESLRKNLAGLAGCSPDEIAVNRNSTEGLETIIFGLQLKAGDEIVASKLDYPAMLYAWKQREMRDGVKVNLIDLNLPSEDESYLVNQYVKAFTPKTKVVHVTHMINWNGQIMPVKRIAEEAHKRGIEVIVDGAQTLAQIKFTIPELGADYFAASLHKWLFAPIGTGLLYVKKDKIKNLYPLFAAADDPKDDIRKFEHLGTRPSYIEQAIGKAIQFHGMIGVERKQKRLQYLKNYWMGKLKDVPEVIFGTSMDPKWGCAIGLVSVKDRKPQDLNFFVLNFHNIHGSAFTWENLEGIRISPSVYTTIKDLDALVEGVKGFAKSPVS
jgi:selenocysteine lyase/cysteine desulfurase